MCCHLTNYLNDTRISAEEFETKPAFGDLTSEKNPPWEFRHLSAAGVCLSLSRQHEPHDAKSVFYLTRRRLPSVVAELRVERHTPTHSHRAHTHTHTRKVAPVSHSARVSRRARATRKRAWLWERLLPGARPRVKGKKTLNKTFFKRRLILFCLFFLPLYRFPDIVSDVTQPTLVLFKWALLFCYKIVLRDTYHCVFPSGRAEFRPFWRHKRVVFHSSLILRGGEPSHRWREQKGRSGCVHARRVSVAVWSFLFFYWVVCDGHSHTDVSPNSESEEGHSFSVLLLSTPAKHTHTLIRLRPPLYPLANCVRVACVHTHKHVLPTKTWHISLLQEEKVYIYQHALKPASLLISVDSKDRDASMCVGKRDKKGEKTIHQYSAPSVPCRTTWTAATRSARLGGASVFVAAHWSLQWSWLCSEPPPGLWRPLTQCILGVLLFCGPVSKSSTELKGLRPANQSDGTQTGFSFSHIPCRGCACFSQAAQSFLFTMRASLNKRVNSQRENVSLFKIQKQKQNRKLFNKSK